MLVAVFTNRKHRELPHRKCKIIQTVSVFLFNHLWNQRFQQGSKLIMHCKAILKITIDCQSRRIRQSMGIHVKTTAERIFQKCMHNLLFIHGPSPSEIRIKHHPLSVILRLRQHHKMWKRLLMELVFSFRHIRHINLSHHISTRSFLIQ
ncbi:hypothetical protein D3C76_1269400 [compost metagenome]